MKKLLALVLVAMLALFAVSALAENSKGNSDIAGATTTGEGYTLTKITPEGKLAEIITAMEDAGKAGKAIDGLPEGAKGLIPEGLATINDYGCYKLEGDGKGVKEFEMIFKFETPFGKDEKVTLLIGIAPADADVEWLKLDGTGNADGDVVVKVTEAELTKISNNPFVVIPVSK